MPKRTLQYSFDIQGTHSYAASASFAFVVSTPAIQLRPGDKVRAQHCEAYAMDASRKIQLFGSLGCGLQFNDRAGAAIDGMTLNAINPTTPDATVVPVDQMDVAAEDNHFLELSAMNFGASAQPTQVALFATCNAHNSDGAAAHVLTLGILGVIEVETEF